MNKNGIRILLSAVSILLAALCGTAQSQPYPSKPVKFVVPFPPGGTPAEFGAFISAENEKWGRVARTANIKLD